MESLVRIDSHDAAYSVDKNKVGIGIGSATGEAYGVDIIIDNSGVPSSSLHLSAYVETGAGLIEKTFMQLPLSIDFDTFYKLTVQFDSDQAIDVSLYDLNDALLGSISSPKVIESDKGIVAIDGRYASTYNDFYLSGSPVVPIPAAVWLFGSGLIGLVCVARRKKA